MPKYDRQLIIMFHCGNSDDVRVVKEGAKALNKKGQQDDEVNRKSHLVTAPINETEGYRRRQVLKEELAKLTSNSRLYIYGHCDWGNQKVGTYTAVKMAELLNYCNLRYRVKVISIVACKAARDYDPNAGMLNCFASQLLTKFADLCLDTVVYARSDTTGVFKDPTDVMYGRKWTMPDNPVGDNDARYQEPGKKWKFTYSNGSVHKEEVMRRGEG